MTKTFEIISWVPPDWEEPTQELKVGEAGPNPRWTVDGTVVAAKERLW